MRIKRFSSDRLNTLMLSLRFAFTRPSDLPILTNRTAPPPRRFLFDPADTSLLTDDCATVSRTDRSAFCSQPPRSTQPGHPSAGIRGRPVCLVRANIVECGRIDGVVDVRWPTASGAENASRKSRNDWCIVPPPEGVF